MSDQSLHQPVLVSEVMDILNIQPNQWYLDLTFGGGGHTKAILEKKGKVVAFDHDREAIERGLGQFKQEIRKRELILIRENFSKLKKTLTDFQLTFGFTGVIGDFGTSVDQLKYSNRGFSFETNSDLDMRMDDRLGVKAKDFLNVLDERSLAQVFLEYGGEEHSRIISRAIVQRRHQTPIETTQELVETIESVKHQKGHLHPATKVFQALRIVTNLEFENLELLLSQVLDVVSPSGVITMISFHDGEDRRVKQAMKDWQEKKLGETLFKKPLQASSEEVQINNRARSAKLRGFKKL